MTSIKRPERHPFTPFRTALLALAAWAVLAPAAAAAASSAVVIMYHRFGEDDYPSTSVRLEQLEAHIVELTSGAYHVLPVPEIVRRIAAGDELPDRTVGITIDDAYRSVFTEAWPRFKAAGLPVTLFASTAHLDGGAGQHMTWDQVREMREGGASIGHHTVSHLHMPKAGAERIEKEIDGANERFQTELGMKPGIFAYPYGEASLKVMDQIKAAGFVAAFGQHSGVIGNTVGRYYLPRFAMNEKYGSLERLRLAANALPLPVSDITPPDPLIDAAPGPGNPPAMGFTISRDVGSLGQLACFLSHAGRGTVERLGPSRIELRIDKPFPKGRTRLNCTLPGPDGRWRWFGRQYYRP